MIHKKVDMNSRDSRKSGSETGFEWVKAIFTSSIRSDISDIQAVHLRKLMRMNAARYAVAVGA
jgi:hypothetical protein